MRKLLSACLVAFVLIVWFAHEHVEAYENSFVFVTADRTYDPIGLIRNQMNKLVRNCSHVKSLAPDSQSWLLVQNFLNTSIKSNTSIKAEQLLLMQQGNWLMVESKFSNAESAIFVFYEEDNKLRTYPNATWSGSAAPFVTGPIRRAYVQSQVPAIASSLLQCFDPTLEYFQ